MEIKRKAPNAHTMLEIVRARWGNTAHKVFFVFAILTNIIVTAMLLLGGASVMNALTGMNLYAACMLIPAGVILYTAVGGLKATFMASCINSWYVLAMLCTFSLSVYASGTSLAGGVLGSPAKVWENLNTLVKAPVPADAPANLALGPVPDNKGGSYLTMYSQGGLIFGIINIVGNFGTVFVDQSYYMGAIASKPSASWKGYILGGMIWFAIPFTLATSLGLGARAAGLPITSAEAGSGLVPPATAVYLMGSVTGSWLIALMLLMAVTSTANSELIAVSSLIAYDIYRTYINPKATGKQIVMVTRISIVCFGIFMGILAIILFEIGLSLGWVYLFMGIAIGGAVFPIYACLTWKKASATGAIIAAPCGTIAGLIVWLVTCQGYYGSINVDNLGGNYPMLGGNLAAIFISMFVHIGFSLAKPQNYDWQTTREITLVEEDGVKAEEFTGEDSPEAMDKAAKYMAYTCWGMSLVLIILWPVLTLPAGVFSKSYFTFWVILSIIWGLVAAAIGVGLPLWESREAIGAILKGLLSCSPREDAPVAGAGASFPAPSFGKMPEEAMEK